MTGIEKPTISVGQYLDQINDKLIMFTHTFDYLHLKVTGEKIKIDILKPNGLYTNLVSPEDLHSHNAEINLTTKVQITRE